MRILLLKKFILISDNASWHTATLRLAGIADMRGCPPYNKKNLNLAVISLWNIVL